jgi:hypothetical protein
LPIARTRSSKHQCRTEWIRIPKHERPTIQEAIDALKVWNRCEQWKKDGNAYVPGLHRWIKARQWENLPETSAERDAAARYRTTPKSLPATNSEDAATPEDIAEILGAIKPKRMHS